MKDPQLIDVLSPSTYKNIVSSAVKSTLIFLMQYFLKGFWYIAHRT